MVADRHSVQRWLGGFVAAAITIALIWIAIEHGVEFDGITNPSAAISALLLVMLGITGQALTWYFSLRATGSSVRFKAAFIAHAVTIWAKYVPGKIWSVSGRAAALAYMGNEKMSRSIAASGAAQLIMIIVAFALALGNLGSGLGIQIENSIATALPIFVGSMTAIMCVSIYMKKRYNLGRSHLRQVFASTAMAILTWALWGLAFSQLLLSMGVHMSPINAIAIFAASALAGILTIFTPGGLGIREGVLSALLVNQGIPLGEAAMISILARLLFVAGETAMFMIGLLKYRQLKP